jgi:trimethylamine:corrinoid methyltransferase-like protein
MLESGVTFDLAQLVLDAEMIAMTKYARKGIQVGDATTAIEEIIEVGPANHYLTRKSTLEGVRKLSTTRFIDRQVREGWEMSGSPEIYELARREAKRLLAEHQVQPLPDDAAEQIHAMVVKADEEMGVFT